MTEPTAQPALDELLNLATATRPDINRDQLHNAVIAARTAGWTWPRILVETACMLARGEEPRDLRNATTAQPWQRPRRKDYDHHG